MAIQPGGPDPVSDIINFLSNLFKGASTGGGVDDVVADITGMNFDEAYAQGEARKRALAGPVVSSFDNAPPPSPDPVEVARENAKRDREKAYQEAKARSATSRSSLEALVQQFHDIAAGRTKTAAEGAFENQYRNAQSSAMANLGVVEGVDQAELARVRAQQAGAMAARQEQDRSILQQQIREQATRSATGVQGAIAGIDEKTADLDAFYRSSMNDVDWEEKTGEAMRRWDAAKSDYGQAAVKSGLELDDYKRDASFWNSMATRGAELGGTAAAYGSKAGWFKSMGGE